jgi:flagellar biosynthesis GTPase FlhF
MNELQHEDVKSAGIDLIEKENQKCASTTDEQAKKRKVYGDFFKSRMKRVSQSVQNTEEDAGVKSSKKPKNTNDPSSKESHAAESDSMNPILIQELVETMPTSSSEKVTVEGRDLTMDSDIPEADLHPDHESGVSKSVIEERVQSFFSKRPTRQSKLAAAAKTKRFFSNDVCDDKTESSKRSMSHTQKGKQRMDEDYVEVLDLEMDSKAVESSSKAHRDKKVHAFFMTKQQRKEQKHIEKIIQFQQQIQDSKTLVANLTKSQSSQANSFFESRGQSGVPFATTATRAISYHLLDFPLSWQVHVGRNEMLIEDSPSLPLIWQVRRQEPLYEFESDTSIPISERDYPSEIPSIIVNTSPHHAEYPTSKAEISKGKELPWSQLLELNSKSISQVNANVVNDFARWIKEWSKNIRPAGTVSKKKRRKDDDFIASEESDDEWTNGKIALLIGPTGCGKTSLVHNMAKRYGYEVIECNTSQTRSGKVLQDLVADATTTLAVNRKVSFFARGTEKAPKTQDRNIVLLDDVDVLLESDRGFWPAVQAIGSTSKSPIVLTATTSPFHSSNLALNPGYSSIASACATFELLRPSESSIVKWMGVVASHHGHHLEKRLLESLLDVSLSRSLLQLQFFCTGLPPCGQSETLDLLPRSTPSKFQEFLDTCSLEQTPCVM